MTSVYDDGYLRLGEDAAGLHETPEGGWILAKFRKQIDLSILHEGAPKTYLKAAPIFPVNATAMKLLKLCNGTRTGRQILQAMADEHGTTVDSVKDAVGPFVRRAIQLSHILPSAKAEPVTVTITGDAAYYLPVHASIEVTTTCNFRCSYCYRSADYAEAIRCDDSKTLHAQLFQILDRLRDAGVTVVELTGGEPLMHPDILEAIEYCGRHFRLCSLLTNGSLIDERVAKALSDAGNFFVSVSLDGPNADLVDRISGLKGSFESICRGIRLLKEHHVHARTAMTVIPQNIDYMEETLRLTVELQGTGFSAAPIMTEGRAKNSRNEQELTCKYLRTIDELNQKYPNALVVSSPAAEEEARVKGNCGSGWRSLTISPDGDVRPCLVNTQQWSIVGNILKQSMKDICASPKIDFFRETKWPRQEVCGDCEHLWYCGNCMMRGIDSAVRRKPDCQWAKDVNIWQWVSRDDDGDEGRQTACRKAQAAKG